MPPTTSSTSSSPSPSSASLLRQYQVLCTIGEGTFGRVSKVRRVSDRAVLVWKELQYGSMSEREKAQLVSEVNILRELSHAHIVRYHDRIIDRVNKRIFIVMEHCGNGDLASLIRRHAASRRPIPAAFVWQVLQQTASALQACHARSFLHRDLKPHNVFLTQDNEVKLGDFGLARRLTASSPLTHTHAGTPYYMSPEQCRGAGAGVKSDVWSLGCIAYELCQLRPPFLADSILQLARRIEAGDWDDRGLSSQYGEDMRAAIRGMMCVDVSRRWSVDDVLHFVRGREQTAALRTVARGRPAQQAAEERRDRAEREREKEVEREKERERERERQWAEREKRLREREDLADRRERELQRREDEVEQRQRQLQTAESRLRSLQAVHRRSTLTSSPSFPPSSPPASPSSSTSSAYSSSNTCTPSPSLLQPSAAQLAYITRPLSPVLIASPLALKPASAAAGRARAVRRAAEQKAERRLSSNKENASPASLYGYY